MIVEPSRCVQIGLRGCWPGEEAFAWQRERASPRCSCTTSANRGIASVAADTIAIVGDGPCFVSVDVDVLDPAFAPGTGTPEPGGMTAVDLLWACRTLAARAHRTR